MNAFEHFPHAAGPLTRLGAALQAAGFKPLQVNNGGAVETANTWDEAWTEACSVCEAALTVQHIQSGKNYYILLIPGNGGAEIVSDYSAGSTTEAKLLANTIDAWSNTEDGIAQGTIPAAAIDAATLSEIDESIRMIRARTTSFIDQATKLSRALIAAAKASPEAASAINQVLGTIALTR